MKVSVESPRVNHIIYKIVDSYKIRCKGIVPKSDSNSRHRSDLLSSPAPIYSLCEKRIFSLCVHHVELYLNLGLLTR